jgi:hypothetical protein
MRRAVTIAVALGVATQLSAQMPDGSANRAAIEKLSFMIGSWRGDAWQMQGPGNRVETRMHEVVTLGPGGAVLLVEGKGEIPGEGGSDGRVVHHAFGIISFDPGRNSYTLRSYLANGMLGDFDLVPVEGGVMWSREVPGGRIRYTAKYGNGEWHEIGEFSRDGTTWSKMMEMRLKKQ